ncbi:hypothetical protein JYU34_015059 [Plutella xylostella]|uniref:Uncharacterized protein n=1 Tax=Plutella xylostella TaxID=51655 RepID=A0ABQ7Q689_PLUXY|nr:hypothetical protein JYU34_015059 [Plutella xylostella]
MPENEEDLDDHALACGLLFENARMAQDDEDLSDEEEHGRAEFVPSDADDESEPEQMQNDVADEDLDVELPLG